MATVSSRVHHARTRANTPPPSGDVVLIVNVADAEAAAAGRLVASSPSPSQLLRAINWIATPDRTHAPRVDAKSISLIDRARPLVIIHTPTSINSLVHARRCHHTLICAFFTFLCAILSSAGDIFSADGCVFVRLCDTTLFRQQFSVHFIRIRLNVRVRV